MSPQGYPHHSRTTPQNNTPEAPPLNVARIKFVPLEADLFDGVAKQTAKTLSDNSKSNKPTQLRRFYDEICLWAEKTDDDETFRQSLPFIRMLNAKAAYALGRNKLVDQNFVTLMGHCLGQVNDAASLKLFKLFMEAVMGFYKELRPRDS
ncbi:MAG: type III-A CRISPR-associated protein Csm2 [Magnetococcales bacterium]|nr:type III-A CRISPR-associated protein Csm2 [Magnetococcales bacterium]